MSAELNDAQLNDTEVYIAINTFSDMFAANRAAAHLEHLGIPLLLHHSPLADGELSYRLMVSSRSYQSALRIMAGFESAAELSPTPL